MERKIHQFAASDKSHPASSEILLLLAKLGGQLKLAGYVPELIWRDLASVSLYSLYKTCELGQLQICGIWIDFYSNFGKIGSLRRVFNEKPDRDVYACTTIVFAYVCIGDLSSTRGLFEEMLERNTATWNTMIDGYARMRNVDFEELTTMITCYSQHQKFREALAIFNEMTSNGIHLDEVTLATVILACAHLGALDLGKEIHLYIL
ncbi:pentatricopeptide repeat-containing protein [Quercus suber]|uniref:Pentatricopeptide repeat-containing protein n=1 Tax=Quercus suber TaxID=58331 RepID=A0AAW0KQL7_QUESU